MGKLIAIVNGLMYFVDDVDRWRRDNIVVDIHLDNSKDVGPVALALDLLSFDVS
jgi:hypothetical protein